MVTDVLDYILEGLEAELALERELGVRTFEIDRSLLAPPTGVGVARESGVARDSSDARVARAPETVPPPLNPSSLPPPSSLSNPSNASNPSFVFLHDKPLSPKGVEMMAKIITALGKTAESAPVVIAPPVPNADTYVVLGGLALKKWFPGKNAAPGMRFTSEKGKDVLVTYSPEYILRFTTVTPAVQKIKAEMWKTLKALKGN